MKSGYKRLAVVLALIFIGLSFLAFVGANENQKKHHNLREIFGREYANPASLKGSGTRNDPYIIDSLQALLRFRESVNGGYDYNGEYVLQTVDIDLSTEENWTPIGIFDSGKCFGGTYNGGGHFISNLNIDAPDENVGFFGYLGGTVANLGIESGTLRGNCVGAIASHAENGNAKIINCYNKATVIGNRVGGIADNFTGALIYNCYNIGDMDAAQAGAIVGFGGTVIDCYSATSPIYGNFFEGNYKATEKCFQPQANGQYSLAEVCDALNGNLQSISINYLYTDSVYKWSAEGSTVSFGDKAPNLYGVYFAVGALILLAIIFIIQFFYLSSRKKASPRKPLAALAAKWCGFKDGVREIGYVKFTAIQLILSTFALSFLALLLGNFSSLYSLTYDNCSGLFCDFYVPIKYICDKGLTVENFYDVGENYPPIARLITWVYSWMIPTDHLDIDYFQASVANFLYVASIILVMVLLYRALERKITENKYRVILALCLTFCAPMMFVVERANIIIISIFLSAVFLLFYDSKSPMAREIALICLAFAAAIKLYPAILGVVLVHDRRYKQTVRCVIYGIAAFFGPFMFIGGFEALMKFIRNLTEFSSGDSAGIRSTCVNFANIIPNILSFFGVSHTDSRALSVILLIPVSVALLACAVFIKEKWKAVLAATALLVLIPNSAAFYMMSFYIFPLFFLLNKQKHTASDLFYAVFLIICVMPIQFLNGIFKLLPVTVWQISASAQLILILGLFADGIIQLSKFIRSRKTIQ